MRKLWEQLKKIECLSNITQRTDFTSMNDISIIFSIAFFKKGLANDFQYCICAYTEVVIERSLYDSYW